MHGAARATALALALLAPRSSSGNAYLPTSVATDYSVDVEMDTEAMVVLESLTPLPDPGEKGGQLNWPIYLSKYTQNNVGRFDDLLVDSVSLTLRGLFHEHAGDLDIKVLHAGSASTLSGNRCGSRDFGLPNPREYSTLNRASQRRSKFTVDPVRGRGFDYTFADLVGINLASNKTGEASSTMAGESTAAWRATDGDILTSGMATHTSVNPWYQVDLGETQAIGTVVLWTPDPENQINEIQIIKTRGRVTLGGTFTLALDHNGFTEITEPISHNAVPSRMYEVDGSTEAGIGESESLQAKIEALDNVGLVGVTRSDADITGGYEWTITFLTERSNLNELSVYSNDLEAGLNRLPEDQDASVTVTTVVNGTSNTFYNANMRLGSVLVSDTPFGSADLDAARAMASVEREFDIAYRQRQINVPMPTGTSGRYLRVLLRQESYLSIAEILVFEQEMFSLNVFDGGSPIPAGSYAPELAFMDAFGGEEIAGDWVLSIRDTVEQSVEYESTSRRRRVLNGRGAISDWVLTVTPQNATTGESMPHMPLTFFVDISATVLSLPKYGKLYEAEAFVRGELIEATEGLEIFTGACAPMDCNHKFGLGNILSTDRSGSKAAPNKINQHRAVVYVPNTRFRGIDTFTYRINVGTTPGTTVGTVTLNVKRCRIDCRNDRWFGVSPSIDVDLTTPWDGRGPSGVPPDRILQPELYGNRIWNDPYCDNEPCNDFDSLLLTSAT